MFTIPFDVLILRRWMLVLSVLGYPSCIINITIIFSHLQISYFVPLFSTFNKKYEVASASIDPGIVMVYKPLYTKYLCYGHVWPPELVA